ncbi:Flp pilus assembly protein CpaB [Sphingomicrobium sediminis]|uniref:Flp pilus assembly protein CpaB n=1 Tax=Sphingomicrobium sediminis TaxID=2950949 RepID=A0A9X2EI14_9SPHN|nr:Flp pilus assembly protein CpaB [Sphingomicrobium sediminis]MCM8557116.1 Flp pilus assembly protein CpaB [Sphingomicrobium sediminis]
MNAKKLMLLVGALVIAVVTAVMAKNMFSGAGAVEAEAAAVPTGPKVLVARKALPVGTLIDAEALTYQAWPEELVQNAYYTEEDADSDPSALIGTVVRSQITAGQPITRGSLVGPDDRGFLAAALGPGMRAITVPIEVTRGAAGFIFPGDRVDMILTQNVAATDDGPPLQASETIIRNLRVLATDQRLDAKDEEGKQVVTGFSMVTFEVTPKIAEKIQVSQNVGTLSLVLRSIADNQSELERAVAAGEVEVPEGATPADERRILLQVANRPIDTNTTYTTGGQVSRFQRSSMAPVKKPDAYGANNNNVQAAAANAVPAGPTVRVARGNVVSIVPVGSR